MKSYKLFITRKAQKELDKIPSTFAKNIVKKLTALENNPHPPNSKKLGGKNNFLLRIGSFRALYTVDRKKREVTVLRIANRKTIYKKEKLY